MLVSLKILLGGMMIWMLPVCSMAQAGARASLMEVYTDERLLGLEQSTLSHFHGFIGGGMDNNEGIIGDARRETFFGPFFIVKYDDWAYLGLGGGGLWLFHFPEYELKLGTSINVHPGGPLLLGMDKRRSSLDGSIDASWQTPMANFQLSYNRDIGKASHGDSASLGISHIFLFNQVLFNQEFIVVPGVTVEWENTRLVDYYYGVRPEEATTDRPAYVGRETAMVGANLMGIYRINRSWALWGDIHTKHFGAGIVDSPIVTRRNTTGGFVLAVWIF